MWESDWGIAFLLTVFAFPDDLFYIAALRLRTLMTFQGRCPWLNYGRTFGAPIQFRWSRVLPRAKLLPHLWCSDPIPMVQGRCPWLNYIRTFRASELTLLFPRCL